MAPKRKKEKEAISKKEYEDILNGLELEEISMVDGKFSLKNEELSPESNLKISEKFSYEMSSGGAIIIYHSYKLSVINKKTRRKSLGIECTLCVNYSSKKEFTQEFFEIFKDLNLPVNTWPFFREYVFNVTSRMYIPPLTLPLLKRFAK